MASAAPLGKAAEEGADISVPAGSEVSSPRARLISSAHTGPAGQGGSSFNSV